MKFKKEYNDYLSGIVDANGEVKKTGHTTSAPEVYISDKWGGKWARIRTFDVQSIELRSASSGEDTAVVKYRYGHIAYPNAPGDNYFFRNTERFSGTQMWIRIIVDNVPLFQGVLVNVDDEFYGRGKDNDAKVPCGVQTFTFKGGLYLLGRFRFYKSFWHTDGGVFEENKFDGEKDIIIDWIPDFGGEAPLYSKNDTPEMELQETTLGNMLLYAKEVNGKAKTFVSFGGTGGFRPEGAFAYLANLIDLNKWNGPKFDVDLRYIKDDLAEKQLKAEPVMNARDFLLGLFDTESGYDFYFKPTAEGYTIVPFPRQYNENYFWVNPQHTAVASCTLSRNTEDYYTAVRVVGERVIYNVVRKFKPTPLRSYIGLSVNDKNENDALTMFDWYESRDDYKNAQMPGYNINHDGTVTPTGIYEKWCKQTRYREVLTDYYYDHELKWKVNGPRVWLDARSYNQSHGGTVIDANNVQWELADKLEVGVEPFQQSLGIKLKVKHWNRLLDGKLYMFNMNTGTVIAGDNSSSEAYSVRHRPSETFPLDVRKNEVPDICMREVKAHIAFETDDRFQFVFGDYQDEYRTLTVYEPDARLILSYDSSKDPSLVVCRNDFNKLKARYEKILQEYKEPTAALTCHIKGILSPEVLGKRITVAGEDFSQITRTSLDHISYSFPEGKAPQTRI